MRLDTTTQRALGALLWILTTSADARERVSRMLRYGDPRSLSEFLRTVLTMIFPQIFFAGGGTAGCDSPGYQADMADLRAMLEHPLREWLRWVRQR